MRSCRWIVAFVFAALPVGAEVCWDYTDFELANVPIRCVEMGDLTTPCSWNPSCNVDLDPSDCCTAIADPGGSQTIGEMHVAWHDCLGNVGTAASPPPPNRGLRWYAFHRQFESDFNVFREGLGLTKIDSLEWCPGMVMPYGHFGAGLMPGAHPLGCGTGANRPGGVTCDTCVAFDQCLYVGGAGPASCPGAPEPGCSEGGVTFPYTELSDFQNVDEVATLLDVFFHGQMHGAVSVADGGGYNSDCANPNCSPRDAMFWRLHKALDDVVRAWQDLQAVDVTLVIDRSGSMAAGSGTGVGTRLDNAIEAADMFADLLEEGRTDGAVNRIGIVSYSSNASNAALNLPLQDVDANLRDPAGAFAGVLGALSPSGSTSIGAGVVAAVEQLCPGGDCSTYVPPPGENERKAILLLTDGLENTSPCLEPGCTFFGPSTVVDQSILDVTQLCAVGLGNAASINGDLLTTLAEQQGGIYLNNTDATGDDLKDFFAKCFAELTDEFIGLDPEGLLLASEAAGPIVPYDSCDDSRITFTAGWTDSTLPGDRLKLLVTTPDGDAWVPRPGIDETSSERSWAFDRTPLPYDGEAAGTWTMQLVRPHESFVNGFTSDAFVDFDRGVRLVRREIQRLCPLADGGGATCRRVLYFEDGARGPSVYERALKEESRNTVGEIEALADPRAFAKALADRWDLIVYARQAGADRGEPYDQLLARAICGGTRAIVTDTRSRGGAATILRCAGAVRDRGAVNLSRLIANPGFGVDAAELRDSGHRVFSYGVRSLAGTSAAGALTARFDTGKPSSGAVAAKTLAGSDLHWHKNVLVTGLSQLTAFAPISVPSTGDPMLAAVRILPSFLRAGGYPGGRMTVEIESPTRGLGGLTPRGGKTDGVEGDPIDAAERFLEEIAIPTTREVFELNDDGKEGDEHPQNGTYMTRLPLSYAVDGMYTFHYRFEYPAGACTTRRELKHTLFVDVEVSPAHSEVSIGDPVSVEKGRVYPVRMRPQDALGNVVGPTRKARPECSAPCACDPTEVVDHQEGSYTIPVLVPAGTDLASCTLEAFGAGFHFGGQKLAAGAATPAAPAAGGAR